MVHAIARDFDDDAVTVLGGIMLMVSGCGGAYLLVLADAMRPCLGGVKVDEHSAPGHFLGPELAGNDLGGDSAGVFLRDKQMVPFWSGRPS